MTVLIFSRSYTVDAIHNATFTPCNYTTPNYLHFILNLTIKTNYRVHLITLVLQSN